MNPHCVPSKIPVDSGAEAKTLPSEASQPYEAAIFACFERYRLDLNDERLVDRHGAQSTQARDRLLQ